MTFDYKEKDLFIALFGLTWIKLFAAVVLTIGKEGFTFGERPCLPIFGSIDFLRSFLLTF
jgi:hypothetical protein